MKLVATFINRLEAIGDIGQLFELERNYEEISRQSHRDSQYFRVFSVFLPQNRIGALGHILPQIVSFFTL